MAKAFVLAAGLGSRMREVTKETPKPLVTVNGIRIIDTLLDAFVQNGIKDITIIRGYKKEKFTALLEKYPFLKFVNNDEFDRGNNITSLYKVADDLEDCYIAEADLLVNNSSVIDPNPQDCFYLGYSVGETTDWCFDEIDGKAVNYRKGGKNTFQAIGISYWPTVYGRKLSRFIKEIYTKTKDVFWEEIPLRLCSDSFDVPIRKIQPSDILEIDSLEELAAIDGSYKNTERL